MRAHCLLLAVLWMMPALQAAPRIEETLRLQLPAGRQLEARLLRPAQAGGRRPALILFGGLERGAAALDLVTVDQPLLLASFDYPLQLPDTLRWREAPQLLREIRRAVPETLLGIAELHRQLSLRPDVDPKRITIVGVSAGAPFATIAAEQCAIPALIVIHGFGDARGVVAWQFERKWSRRYGEPGRWAAWLVGPLIGRLMGLPVIETHARGLRPEQRALMIRAESDRLIPQRASESLWQALRESPAQVEQVVQRGGHVSGRAGEQIEVLLGISVSWLQRQGLIDLPISNKYDKRHIDILDV
jgi:dienelactone hydrolase